MFSSNTWETGLPPVESWITASMVWSYPYLSVLEKPVVSLLRNWTVFSFLLKLSRSLRHFFYTKHLCNRNSDKKSVICIYFYRLIDWKMLDTFFNSGKQIFDYCLLPISFFLQIDRLKTGKIALGNHLFDKN
jgi:hypothetical protein